MMRSILKNNFNTHSKKYLLFFGFLIVGLVIVIKSTTSGYNKLDENPFNYFEPYPLTNDLNILIQSGFGQKAYAFKIYNQGDYSEAIVNLKYALVDYPNDPELNFYLGVSFMAIHDYRSARKQFQNLINENHNYKEAGKWYLALCSYMVGNFDEAELGFTSLSNDSSEFSSRADQILVEFFNN